MNSNYQIEYYKNSHTGKEPAREYINNLDQKIQAKIDTYLNFLRESKGYLKYPYAKHLREKIWELRIDFANNHHRIFYFVFTGQKIVLLHAFSKKTNKTPRREIKQAVNNYEDFINSN